MANAHTLQPWIRCTWQGVRLPALLGRSQRLAPVRGPHRGADQSRGAQVVQKIHQVVPRRALSPTAHLDEGHRIQVRAPLPHYLPDWSGPSFLPS
eukprot:789172-Pyramimonas_sp.AAC.2